MRHALPEPYPGELAYGTLARLARVRGRLPRTCESRHVARYSCQITPISIALLPGVIHQFPYPDAAQVLSHYLEEHSVLPYVRATRPQSIAADFTRLADSLALDQLGTRFVRAFVGVSGKVGRTAAFRFCDECAAADSALFGESWWHRVHFLPNTLVCETHNLWLRHVAHDGLHFVSTPAAFDLGEQTHMSISARPPKAFYELAALDRAILAIGQNGQAIADALYAYCANRLAEPARSGLRPAESLGQALQEKLGTHVHALSAFTGRQLPDYYLSNALREVRLGRLSARATVLLAYVFGVDSAQLAVVAQTPSCVKQFEMCGARACSAYRVDWALVLSRSVGSALRIARSVCSRCGFNATMTLGNAHPRVHLFGSSTTSLLRELTACGINTTHDLSVATGLSEQSVNVWRTKERKRNERVGS